MYVTTFDKDAICASECEREEQTRIKSIKKSQIIFKTLYLEVV